MPLEGKTDADMASMLARALWPLLNHNQGVVIHDTGDKDAKEGYYVAKLWDEDAGEWQIKIVRDDTVLVYGDRDFLNLTMGRDDH